MLTPAHLSARLVKSIGEERIRQRPVELRGPSQASRGARVLTGMGLAPAGNSGVTDRSDDGRVCRFHAATIPDFQPPVALRDGGAVQGGRA